MIRVGDKIRTNDDGYHFHGSDVARVVGAGEDGCLRALYTAGEKEHERSLDDGAATLLCFEVWCTEPAAGFLADGSPVCERCSEEAIGEVFDVRPDPVSPPLLACACGDALDEAKSEGIWTMAEIACEYRTCLNCGSTRAWMPVNEIPGRPVKEATGRLVESEWDGLLDALDEAVPLEGGTLLRGTVVVARAFACAGGGYGWRVSAPERENQS